MSECNAYSARQATMDSRPASAPGYMYQPAIENQHDSIYDASIRAAIGVPHIDDLVGASSTEHEGWWDDNRWQMDEVNRALEACRMEQARETEEEGSSQSSDEEAEDNSSEESSEYSTSGHSQHSRKDVAGPRGTLPGRGHDDMDDSEPPSPTASVTQDGHHIPRSQPYIAGFKEKWAQKIIGRVESWLWAIDDKELKDPYTNETVKKFWNWELLQLAHLGSPDSFYSCGSGSVVTAEEGSVEYAADDMDVDLHRREQECSSEDTMDDDRRSRITI
ncbi:hypothetical protein B0T19DRAFT_467130 [Cercophora scortea]|uniref:Uncharacterized protein n=1 Tax=Cercophora scortea TaxID=314031 RepID=A0AAE0I747_9PEZI|nr:hypothetical protein B0T19DRAFT_467130 [Cercophora scortea]